MTHPARLLLRAALALGAVSWAYAPGAGTTTPDGPISTSFKVLAGWRVTDAVLRAKPGHVLGHVPGSIRNMDGKEVVLTGFMLPIRIHNRLVTEFMLMRNQNTCCFGIPPELHEVVEVLKVDTPTKVLMDTPIAVVGRLHVRERWEGTFLCSIYQLDAEKITDNAEVPQ